MSKFFSQYKLKEKKKVEEKEESPFTLTKEEEFRQEINEEKKDETIKPNIINRYVNEALGVSSEAPKENPLQKKSISRRWDTSETESILVKGEILQKIEKQLNTTLGKINTSTKRSPLQKKVEVKKEEPGLLGVEYEVHENPKFMKEFSRHELKHRDHSSLIVAKGCLRKYFYKEVINVIPSGLKNIFFPWGSAFHLFKQRLSEYYGYGDEEPTKYDHTKAKEAFKKAAREGTEYWRKHGEDQKADSKLDWFTTERLYLSFQKSFEFWAEERKKRTTKVIAVEQYFNVELSNGIFVQGRIDEAIIKDDELWGRDFKTTQKPEKWFKKTLNPNNQVRTYSFGNSKLADRPTRGLIIQALYNAKSTKKGPTGPETYEVIIEVTKEELNQWEKEQAQWDDILSLCREKDVWPQSEVSCQYCEYQEVCSQSTEAAMVYKLQNKYTKHLRNPAFVED